MSTEREPVGITSVEYLAEGSPARIIGDAIRAAALDAQRHPDGSGTDFIDCGGRASLLWATLCDAGLTR